MRNWILKSEKHPVQANLFIAGFASFFLLWTVNGNAVEKAHKLRSGAPGIRCVRPATTEVKIEVPTNLLDAVRRQRLVARFQSLADQWRHERGATSSIEEMCTSPAYLSIMALGPEVLPIVLQQLRSEGDNPDHWFIALHHITQGLDPVPAEDKGDIVKMADAWLKWGEQAGDAG
jgi:hypothetical protein